MRASRRGLGGDEGGVVFVEALMALFPVLFTFLCMVHLATTAAVGLAVRHAATVGARAAMVVLVEDPKHHGGEPRLALAAPRPEGASPKPFRLGAEPPTRETRVEAVRRAVAFVLAPFAPRWLATVALGGGPGASLSEAVGGGAERLLFGLGAYPAMALAVTFPTRPGGASLQRGRLAGDRVTVRVTYLAACVVPVASRLLCAGRRELLPVLSGRRPGEASRVPAPGRLRAALALGARFAVLRAEATMPLQTAGYEEGA